MLYSKFLAESENSSNSEGDFLDLERRIILYPVQYQQSQSPKGITGLADIPPASVTQCSQHFCYTLLKSWNIFSFDKVNNYLFDSKSL